MKKDYFSVPFDSGCYNDEIVSDIDEDFALKRFHHYSKRKAFGTRTAFDAPLVALPNFAHPDLPPAPAKGARIKHMHSSKFLSEIHQKMSEHLNSQDRNQIMPCTNLWF